MGLTLVLVMWGCGSLISLLEVWHKIGVTLLISGSYSPIGVPALIDAPFPTL
jgi:hypothetical protein